VVVDVEVVDEAIDEVAAGDEGGVAMLTSSPGCR